MATLFLRAFIASLLFVVTAAAVAQAYPTRPIRLVVPFAPGGGNDIVGRILAEALTPALGQTVIVENRAGAGSVLGVDIAAKATPDGYTMLMGNIALAFNAALYKKLPYDALRDFAPVTLLAEQPNMLVAHPSIAARTLKDFIALARSAPGKFTYSSAGTGSGTHLAMELLLLHHKLQLVHVPYKGTGPAVVAVLSNEVSTFLSTFASALPHVKAGRLRTFGVTSARRSPALPEAPTIAEAGMPGYEYTTWYGLLVPAGTPRAAIEKLHTTTVSLLNSAELKQRYGAQGMDPTPSAPAALSDRLKSEIEKWGKVVRAANIPQQ
jgi:tripartite-type tricarboxylate transporter receptor subunit TctC